MRKPDFCICQNKDADQLRGNREADQRLCFCYTDSTIPLLSVSEISSLQSSSVAVAEGRGQQCIGSQHRGGDSFDCCTERYEIVVLLPNSEDTCYWKYFLEFE